MLTYKISGNVLKLSLSGELDHYSAPKLRSKIDDLIINEDYETIVFDFAKLDFMDSTGVGLLLGRHKLAKKRIKPVFVLNPTPSIDRVLKVSGIYTLIPKI